MSKPVFFDPQGKRRKRIRRVLDVLGVSITLLAVFFIATVIYGANIGQILFPERKKPYHALQQKERKHPKKIGTHRKTGIAPSQVVLNKDEGIRGAFYVTWDAASFSSLKEYVHQIDLLYPEWLHVLTPDGHLQAVTELNQLYPVIDKTGRPRKVDDKLMPFLKAENAETDVFPMVNNFDPVAGVWNENIGPFLSDPDARARFRREIDLFLTSDKYRGLTLDLEEFPVSAQPGYRALIEELATDLHAKGMKLYIAVYAHNEDFDYAYMAKFADGLILMNYDQHYPGGVPGSIAGQDWFINNLKAALKVIPQEKIICAIGNYGYDWTVRKDREPFEGNAHNVSVQDAWLEAHDSESDVEFDSDQLNPHFSYLDENNARHEVWYLDAVTALNQMRAARSLGITTFALWRLGSEDRSLWQIWDDPMDPGDVDKLRVMPPGQDVDLEGAGEVLQIEARPTKGSRNLELDHDTGYITDQRIEELPLPYRLGEYGGSDKKKVAITFDDGPDPQWTPKILDALKKEHATGTFFIIGSEAQNNMRLLRRVYNEGNEIGNHTFLHPDISDVNKTYMKVELNLTERLFAGVLGIKTLLFRPPYSIDQEPDTEDQVRPLEITQSLGYLTIGDKIDPNDWQRPSAEEITASVMRQLGDGNIILLHDGGGDRSQTVRAIPMIVEGLRSRGYEIVPVSELLGKTRDEVMPPLKGADRFWAKIDFVGFLLGNFVNTLIVVVFFVGDILMTGRLLGVGVLAIFDRFRRRRQGQAGEAAGYRPDVAVLIPAYNEEKVIERTVRSVLDSNYPNLRAIVIDDGSTDRTYDVVNEIFASEIADGRVTLLTQTNGGKARALNYGLDHVTEEIFVGIDADTVIASDAISYLVPNFIDPKLGALAGNAKVGNKINLWTRWQALEYITSQNFERRALNTFSAVSVVPGAIGAWRTEAVRAMGGYHADTVAEDADLTMALLQAGYKVEYEDRAIAYTEAPHNANGLMRQRFRWSFGILQAVYKHRRATVREGALGWIAIPNIIIFQILLPIVSPFIDIMFAYGALKYWIWDRHFHPDTADPASFQKLVIYFALFMVIDFIASTIAFSLERRRAGHGRDWWLLGHVWLQRFAYRQLFSVVLLKTLKRAIEGESFAWDKLERRATVKTQPAVPVGAGRQD
jgi:cellulose synthase/poly-beta-1,6-N-acetylglucosamine synthase-like glycosyltransferase/peptidoglycan/xylan/chitin deacetylase (PgdA/CDA1 family)/spore germination protein YaaH